MKPKPVWVAIARAVFWIFLSISSAKSQPQWDFGDLDIRLADGNGVLDGRVERQINGVWGTVCNSNFDIKDAQVICRMLSSNLTALQVIKDGRYGQGQGPIFYDRLRCSGTELSIDDCYSITGEQCLHNQDVAIVCSACPSSEDFYFGEFQNISVVNNVQVYHGLCGNGTSEYEFAYTCATDGVWYPRNNSCRHLDITDIRFTDGLGLYDGIVEVLVGDTWGSTCDNEYTLARVVCNAIGATVRSYGPKYSTTPPFLDGLICERFDSGINNCSYNTFASCTYKNYVACEVRPLNITNIRLADGPGENAGKVELFVDGHWGKVCENSFDINDAKVLCSMLGARTTAYLLGNFYGNGSGPALLNYLGCRGTENTTNECSYGAPYYYRGYYWSYYTYTHDCYQSDSVSLICTDCGLISTTDGQIKSFDNTAMELTVLCNPGYTVSYTCLSNGSWVPNTVICCKSLISRVGNGHQISFNSATLRSTVLCDPGYNIEYTCHQNGTWTSEKICCSSLNNRVSNGRHISFNSTTFRSTVLCDPGYNIEYTCHQNGTWTSDEICCPDLKSPNGNIHSFNTTTMTATLWCYAGIYMENTCLSNGSWTSDENCPNILQDVRLVDGVGLYDGRIEVLYNGTWGTICRNNYRYQNSYVICRMLGASRQEETTRFGAGSGPIHFENLYCQGSETDLSECTVDVDHTCSHSLDAGVICYKYRRILNITGVRLADGTSKYDGRVELEENGVWGTVCDDGFDFNDGNTLCRMMNMSVLKYFTGSKHGSGSGPMMFDRMGCSSYHNHIKDCGYYTPLNCFPTETVSLLCSECGPVNEYGTASYSENGTLATITCSYDHYTKDPIVECVNGSWSILGVCDFHGPPLNITSVRLVDGINEYEGRVEIEVNGTYGTICDSFFDLNDAETICRTINSSWEPIYVFTGAKYGEGAGPIYIQRLFCGSASYLLEHCPYHSLGVCDHSRDVGIVCSECGQPSISHWGFDYFTYNDSSLYADCSYYKTYLGTLKMTCDQKTKTWITEGECQQYSSPLEIQDMRLSNGQSDRDGRVEIKVFDTWGTICENGFGLAEANVICHMIGFPPAQAVYGVDAYGQGTGPIFVDDLSCGQSDTHINNCTYVTYDDCTHLHDVAVKCTECDDPRPMNGSINGTVFKFESVVEVVCEYGYFLQGERFITCQSDATWSARPECRLIDCGNPLPADGYINGTEFTLGTVFEVICDEGYNISGDSIISCQENRSWSDNTTCNIVDCGELYVENADVDNSNSTTFGKISLVSCFDGYLPLGATPVECLASGAWSETPFCKIRNCSDPTPYRGHRNDTKTSYGTVVLITCDDGLNVTGNAVIVCQANGTWSDRPLCDTSDCGPPVKANGQYIGNTTTGSSATVMCGEGHDLQGPSVVVCDVQGWNESVRCIRQDCGMLTVEDGIVDLNEGTLFGDSAEISCSTGYELNGDARVTCLDGRNWSDYPNCTIIDCGEIDHPTNGALIVPVAFTYGATLSFQCNDGFILSGESFIVCGISGSWNADPPECVPKSPIGGPCEDVKYCLTPNAYCVDGACSCQTGIYDERTDTCDRMPMFPFDSNEPENVLVSTTCSSAITFSPGIPVFKRMRHSLFVCSSGLISFDKAYNNPVPPKKKKTDELADFSVIAPYFAEMDFNKSESVTFRKTDVLNDFPYSELQLSDIERAKDIIRTFEGIATFEPKFLLVTYWKRMVPKQKTFIDTSVSSFQLVLVSDGLSTYFINIYPKDLMQWQTVPINRSYGDTNQPVAVWIGYSVEGRVSPQSKSYKNESLRMDINSKSIISTQNNGYLAVDGMLMKSLTIPGDWQTHDALDCILWYNQHVENKDNYHHIMASAMPACPCDLTLARFDPWFWRIRRSLRWPWWQSNTDVDHNDIICVDMWHRPYFDPYGKSCCYKRSTWQFVQIRPDSGGFYHNHPAFSPQNHYLYDTLMKDKCCTKSEFCDLYYQLHPVGTCYSRSPYRQGNFWGDPHISTLDRFNFTFNGLGEYTLLLIETDDEWFTLQARTQRAVKFDGNLSDATFFSAFAATDRVNASMHVELNSEKNGFVIFGNQIDLTTQYTAAQDNFEFDSSTLSISENNNSLRVTFKESGILLDIGLGVQMLSLSTIVPSRFANITRGLLGNFDGDPFNDLMFPNGTILNPSSNEREIFNYGQNWALTEDSTEFFYEDGKGHSDFNNASYVPRFLFEIDNITMSLAIEACGETSSPECIFDFAATLNPELALDTGNKKNVVDQDQKEIEEVMPVVEGCGVVNTTVGQTVSCELTLDEDLDIKFLGNETFDAAFDRNRSTITYTQSGNMTSALRYQAVNQGGRTSIEYVISVLLCTGCSGHGNCTAVIRSETRNINLRNNECTCHTGYDGPNCEYDYDGCAGNPCSLGRECTDLSPQEQETKGKGFVCGACPEGYTTTEGVDACLDIDECSTNATCEQFCLNTEGSFTCLCEDGYRQDNTNNSKCQDINECEEESHNCTHVCNNTYGGFKCDCREGYELDVTTQLCTQGLWDPCSSTDLDCRNTSGCTLDAHDNPTCFCVTGFELNDTGKECIDINECERNVCSQECTNFIGGFQCSCVDGYMLEGVSTCIECEDSYWGHECNNTCDCNDRGTVECSPVRGCVCEPGWSGSACDDDVNECEVEQNICADVIKLCTNAVGSYSCNCINGFQKDQTGSCIDVNECDNPSLNNCSHDCSNTIGSYSCSCRPGYKILNSLCQDINECTLGLAACEQMCENKPGTYNCYCHFGYRLNDDRRTCTKVSDPCKTLSNLTCSGYCVVNNNTTECRCQHGFVLGEDNQRCFDVDECERSTTNMCDPVSRCINTEGSYICECPVGTRLENDGRTCSECDEYHFGRNCLQECNCIKGVCNSTLGCVCDDGWTGPNCDVDEDECVLESFTCTMPHMHCVNLPGTASCECIAGYHTDKMSGGCIDLNECLDVSTHDCAQICTNMNGSYECSCRTGFNQNGQKCTDIDECQGLRGCEQKCENTLGSYRCSCNEGYKLDLFDRHSCMPETECSTDQYSSCPKNSTCVVVSEDVMCTCPKGYSERTHVCADVDECVDNKHNCMQMCSNINGGYDCLCRIGFYLLSDGVSCDECRPWRYGANCDSLCSCLKDNSKSCNITSGECECKPGWTGESCAQNIDECSLDIFQLCPNDSQCVDTLGSFVCTCNTGFSKNRYGRCEECQHGRFGAGCGQTCGCYMHHTERCDYVTGHCTCDKGWKGVTCEEDNNECNDTNACPRNSDCVNTMGSFECNCHIGFKKRRALGEECIKCYDFTYGGNCNEVCTCTEEHSTGCDNINGSCFCMQGWQGEACSEDVDECRDTSICDSKANSHCVNLIGSYECSCNAGYGVHNGDCKDVNECLTENLSACDKRARCENTAGNYTCECPAGTDLHDDGRSCIVCNNNTFGNGCNDQCNCTQENSETADQSCDTVTGSCLCNPHWTGRFCEMDVNECVTSGICKEANTGCRNIPGGFLCDCLRGFTINNETGKCEYVLPSTALPAEDEVRVNLTLNLDVDLVPGTDLDVKAVFDQVAEKVEKSIRKHMSKYISVPFTILIDDLSLGSINVRYTLIFKKNSDVAKDIFKAVMDMRSGTEIEYDGRNVTALSQESISGDNACEFYETTLGGCGSGYECVYYAGEPTCIELSATDNYSLVVGVTVGLFVFLVAVFVTITAIVVYNRNRKKSSKNLRRESDDKPTPPYWPPWKNTNDTKSRYWNWRSLAMKNQFATPYHLPRAHTDQGSNEAGTQ